MSASTSYLELQDLGKRFGAFQALSEIQLSIQRGEFICFLGPSGCGKTTLLRAIAGLDLQTHGSILQDGRNVSTLPPSRRDYGIVFQSYALFPNLTIEQNIAFGLENTGRSKPEIATRVADLLATVGLTAQGKKYPAQLSGGQQQRVALARALATPPGLLLLDEPLSALDAKLRVHLRDEIRALQQRLGITTVFVTHDQEEALTIADRIVVMNAGRIEQVGTPLEIYRRPADAFVADFIGKTNFLEAVSEGDHWVRCGSKRWYCPPGAGGHNAAFRPGARLALYLRPEDRMIEQHLPEDHPGLCWGQVQQVEFLGGNCLARIAIDGLDNQPVDLQFSLNQMDEFGVAAGRQLRFALRTDRLRVFPAAGSAS
ncbi:UNVERIFIED_ORG: putative 2-aminoethylphosphonate ABC transporter ATP-binding protein [Shinella sp. XGS7]|nr:putative 2-aminoethylphosphonate ABC transporter ATP-binding protein [Shinella sp. XGS7]